jgi:hypothetical protein
MIPPATTEEQVVSAVVFVLFPSLEPCDPATIREIAVRLQERGHAVWVADEADHKRRLKALYVREIYDVGRGASIVMTNCDGVWLDGWYGEAQLPTVDELITAASRVQTVQNRQSFRDRCCRQGHTLTARMMSNHDEWYCTACYFVPTTRELLHAYVEKHGGKVVP